MSIAANSTTQNATGPVVVVPAPTVLVVDDSHPVIYRLSIYIYKKVCVPCKQQMQARIYYREDIPDYYDEFHEAYGNSLDTNRDTSFGLLGPWMDTSCSLAAVKLQNLFPPLLQVTMIDVAFITS
jgi:hypothetical protein